MGRVDRRNLRFVNDTQRPCPTTASLLLYSISQVPKLDSLRRRSPHRASEPNGLPLVPNCCVHPAPWVSVSPPCHTLALTTKPLSGCRAASNGRPCAPPSKHVDCPHEAEACLPDGRRSRAIFVPPTRPRVRRRPRGGGARFYIGPTSPGPLPQCRHCGRLCARRPWGSVSPLAKQ